MSQPIRRRHVQSGLILPIIAALLSGPAVADDRPMRSSAESGQDDRLKDGQLQHSDLLGAGGRDGDVEDLVRQHIDAANRFVDVDAFNAALQELEAADRLVPFHSDVTQLMELIESLRDGARQADALLSDAEQERRAKQVRQDLRKERLERQKTIWADVIERNSLPSDLEQALSAMIDRKNELKKLESSARSDLERCIGASAMAHSHGAGGRCLEDRNRLTGHREHLEKIGRDVDILVEALRQSKGQEAVDKIIGSGDN